MSTEIGIETDYKYTSLALIPKDSEEKLHKIFGFLKENREYNDMVHRLEYKQVLMPWTTLKDKVISLLHYVVNTQSQPKLDSLHSFFDQIEKKGKFETFSAFVKSLGQIEKKAHWTNPESEELNYSGLFNRLKNKKGWGEKTAALFVKAIYKIHNQYKNEFAIWQDISGGLTADDALFLPVDEVILKIFNECIDSNKKWDFKSINDVLKNYWEGADFEIWDDLWFWGFITQKSNKDGRVIDFNPAKLWSLLALSKDAATISDITDKANKFIKKIKE
jgi:hypothetical protein